jgi:phthalate 4,5-dioxygenase reductase component
MPLLRVARAEPAAESIRLFELVAVDGAPLPAFTAGAHVQVRSPAGLVRKYSLCNDPAETHRYVIAVQRDAAGRGGSVDLVDHAGVGDALEVSEPHNAFDLAERAPGFLFIAGGIGITPIMAMLRRCVAIGKPFRLVYCTRSPERTAFRHELAAAPFAGHVTLHHDGGDPARAFDLWPLLEKPGRDHVYCCGPRPMLEAVRDMTGHWPHAAIHFESFVDAAAGAEPADRPFTVVLARSGDRIEVPAGVSILEAMRSRGHDAPSSCESGTCGTCRTRLVSGVADHRDFVLMDDEKDTNVMLCVSRALTPELVIDL